MRKLLLLPPPPGVGLEINSACGLLAGEGGMAPAMCRAQLSCGMQALG